MRRLLIAFALVAAALALPASALAATPPTLNVASALTNQSPALSWNDVRVVPGDPLEAMTYRVYRTTADCSTNPDPTAFTQVSGDLPADTLLFSDPAPPLLDGVYCYFVQADDGVVPANSVPRTVKLDRTPPTITGYTTTGGNGCSPFTITGASADPDFSPPVTFQVDGHPLPPAYPPPGLPFETVNPAIVATDAASNQSLPTIVPGIVVDGTRPPAPVLEVNTDPPQQKVSLSWASVTSDGAPVVSYHLHTKGPGGTGDLNAIPTTTNSLVFSNLQVDATYEYTLYASDVCGDGLGSTRLVRLNDTEAPTVPIVAAPAFDPANHVVALAWIPSSDNIQVDHYEILRNGVPIGATDATTFMDNLPTQHADLSYVVRAVDTNGNESDSQPALISTPDWTSPTAPVLSATADGATVTLRWSAATDNVGVVGYDVLRDGKQIDSVTGAVRTYKDLGVPTGVRTWQVRARDNAGLSATSAGQTLKITKRVAQATLVSVRSTRSGRGTARYALGGPARLLVDMRIVGTMPKVKLRLYVESGRGRITVWRGTPGSSAPRLQLGSALVRHGYVTIRLSRALHAGRVRFVLIARGHISVAATGARKPKMQAV